jgi:hypothetical protein
MDIRYLSRRTHEYAAQSGNSAQAQRAAAPAQAETAEASPAAAAESEGAEQPATTPHFSRAGRMLSVMQSFEQRHPEETKKILSNIAEKLRSDAQSAGPWSGRLEKWADRFQQAADSGDMSKLFPKSQPSGHFGMRAYQQVQQAAEPEAEEVVSHVADTALTQASGTQGAVRLAGVADEAEKLKAVDNGEAPKQSTDAASSAFANTASTANADPSRVASALTA